MANLRFNISFGERYGDVNDPKTSWHRNGFLSVGRNYNKVEPDEADVEALERLVAGGHLTLRISDVPTSKNFDGFFSIFAPRDEDRQAPSNSSVGRAKDTIEDIDDKPIDLSEIPF